MGFRCMLLKGGLFFVCVCEKKMKIYFYEVSKLYIITNFWGSSRAARRDDSARKRFFLLCESSFIYWQILRVYVVEQI